MDISVIPSRVCVKSPAHDDDDTISAFSGIIISRCMKDLVNTSQAPCFPLLYYGCYVLWVTIILPSCVGVLWKRGGDIVKTPLTSWSLSGNKYSSNRRKQTYGPVFIHAHRDPAHSSELCSLKKNLEVIFHSREKAQFLPPSWSFVSESSKEFKISVEE